MAKKKSVSAAKMMKVVDGLDTPASRATFLADVYHAPPRDRRPPRLKRDYVESIAYQCAANQRPDLAGHLLRETVTLFSDGDGIEVGVQAAKFYATPGNSVADPAGVTGALDGVVERLGEIYEDTTGMVGRPEYPDISAAHRKLALDAMAIADAVGDLAHVCEFASIAGNREKARRYHRALSILAYFTETPIVPEQTQKS